MNKFVMFSQNNLALLLTTIVVIIVMIHIVGENMRPFVYSGNAILDVVRITRDNCRISSSF